MGRPFQQTGIRNEKIQKQIMMEQKTKIIAKEGEQELRIIREFDVPLELLFKA